MGQEQSVPLPDQLNSESSEAEEGRSNNGPTTMEALVDEATAFSGGSDENESLEERAQKALNCPCVAELRKGACGNPFSEAFVCFLKSTAEEKGSDCVREFLALQSCIKENPNAYDESLLEEDKSEEESNTST